MSLGQIVAVAAGLLAVVTALLAVGMEWGDMRRQIDTVRTTASQEHLELKTAIDVAREDQDQFEDYIHDLMISRGTWSPLNPRSYEPDGPHTHADGTTHVHP